MGWRNWLSGRAVSAAAETRGQSLENPRTLLSDDSAWIASTVGGMAATGESVTEASALTVAAVWACVRIIAEDVSSLPLQVYERLEPRGKVRATSHPVYALLHSRPNPELTAMAFRETLQAHTLLYGNGYAEVERNRAGVPIALWPIPSHRVVPFRQSQGKIVYQVEVGGAKVFLAGEDMLHLPGLSFDGLRGYSPITVAREAIGLAAATAKYGAKFFGNGAAPGGVLSTDKSLSIEARRRLKTSWDEAHQGLSNSQRVAVLEEGMKWQSIGLTPENSQFLETRKFQVAEICRIFRVPPHMVADMGGQSLGTMEQNSLEYLTRTLRPWLVRWEQALHWTLFDDVERARFFVEHNVEGLLRGDIASRYNAYNIARNGGWMSVNEIRERENLNPLADNIGNIYLAPLNMVPAETIGQMVPKPDAPTPGAPTTTGPATVKPRRSYERLFVDVAERMVSREVYAARKAWAKHPETFAVWIGEFYAGHTDHVERALEAVLEHIEEREGADASAAALGVAMREFGRAAEELRRAVAAGEEIEGILDRWSSTRATEIARRINASLHFGEAA